MHAHNCWAVQRGSKSWFLDPQHLLSSSESLLPESVSSMARTNYPAGQGLSRKPRSVTSTSRFVTPRSVTSTSTLALGASDHPSPAGAADDSDVPAEPCAPGPRPPEAPAPSPATSVPVRAGPGLHPARSGRAAVRAVAEAAAAEAAAGEPPQSDPALSSGKA